MMLKPHSLDDVPLPEVLPPLVLIAFNRPDLLEQVTLAIENQSLLPSKIIAFIDGARNEKDIPLIEECLKILKDLNQKIPVEIVHRETNLGCDPNIVSALDQVLSTYDSLVYLEDDTIPNPFFYQQMCRLLEVYRDSPQVFSVSGYANIPQGFDEIINTDFMVSHRVFCWGFATWADRWKKLNISHYSGQYNPFGSFYHIPANIQTKSTIINQFWLEKNQKTDWNITFTVAALYHQGIHITPMVSLIKNIGFGHSQSKTYKRSEPFWVNCKYDPNACPKILPSSLDLPEPLTVELTGSEFIEYLQKKNLWLNLDAFTYYFRKYKDWSVRLNLINFFYSKISIIISRWRKGFLV